MGTDDLFHKRKARRAASHSRRKARREPYDKVLIVCEGSKTEPQYFNELKNHYKINSANVVVTGDCGSDPLSVWKLAHERYAVERNAGDPFDRVYCVFDKDTHSHYDDAVNQIQSARPEETFYAITSVPCFEFWLLVHFNPTGRPYAPKHGNSPADQVLDELKRYMPRYRKAQMGVFVELLEELPGAIENAKRLLADAERTGTDNPSTRVHELIEYLQNIKDDR